MRVKLEDDETVEIQMAPMIDCVFLLLIFFLVATTLKKLERQIPVELPDASRSITVRAEEQMLVIGVDTEGRWYVGGEQVSLAVLRERIHIYAQSGKEQRVRIDVDRSAPFQYAIQLLDLCQFEELNNVGFNLRRESQYQTDR